MKLRCGISLISLTILTGCSASPCKQSAHLTKAALEQNKATVVAFYTTAFNAKHPEAAVARYVGETYTQHNPGAADGKEAFIRFVNGFTAANPQAHIEIKRAIAEDDLVVTHGHFQMNEHDRGMAVVDIFRLQDGKIVEHWDVGQRVPEKAANANTMF